MDSVVDWCEVVNQLTRARARILELGLRLRENATGHEHSELIQRHLRDTDEAIRQFIVKHKVPERLV